MNIRMEAPPAYARRRKNKSYGRLLDAVREAKGEWVAVDADEIAGNGASFKRLTLKQASEYFGMRIEVTVTDTTVYLRSIEAQVETANA